MSKQAKMKDPLERISFKATAICTLSGHFQTGFDSAEEAEMYAKAKVTMAIAGRSITTRPAASTVTLVIMLTTTTTTPYVGMGYGRI